MEPLPPDPGWRALVEETIARLSRRAAAGERFAELALVGWRAELRSIIESERYWKGKAVAEQARAAGRGGS